MKRRVVALLMAICLMAVMLTGCGKSGADVATESRNGVVRVMAKIAYSTVLYDLQEGSILQEVESGTTYALGSAFAVGEKGKDPEYFVTNRHVVDADSGELLEYYNDAKTIAYVRFKTELLAAYILLDDDAYSSADGLRESHTIPAKVVYQAKSDEPDLAVLKASSPVSGRKVLPLYTGDEIISGKTVYALGYPGSTDETSPDYAGSVAKVTVTDGVVSLHNEFVDNDATVRVIQHTAQINHGNSGGPLINESGAVVGVNTWGYTSSGQTNYYSIEIDYVTDILDDLEVKYYTEDGNGLPIYLIIIAAVVAVAVIAIIIVLVTRRRSRASARPQVAPNVNPNLGPTAPQAPAAPPAAPARPSIPGDSGFRVQGVTGQFANRRIAIPGQLRIGRDPNRNDLVYPADTKGVSSVHCVVFVQNGTVYLKDLGSTYGTFVNGSRLAANQAVALKPGDRFYLGAEQQAFAIDVKKH